MNRRSLNNHVTDWLTGRKPGFTLVELLVVIAVIGILTAILLPAIQSARAAARTTSCKNNLRQLGIASQTYLSANRSFPPGTVAKPSIDSPTTPWTFFRWSALASISPYLENSAAYNGLDLAQPLYKADLNLNPVHGSSIGVVVSTFLCPSDVGRTDNPDFGPTNYIVCTGSGAGGGAPHDTDGIFYENSKTSLSAITDGLSKTALACESVLGQPKSAGEGDHDAQTEYKFLLSAPLTKGRCEGTQLWNVSNPRGFAWVNGEYRCTLYNHYLLPNSDTPDCMGVVLLGTPEVRFRPYGWRTARSRHSGGVNLLKADGSVTFVSDNIDMTIWRGLSTRNGGELSK